MKSHTTRFALLAGVCAAGLALSGCDDQPDGVGSTATGDRATQPKNTERADTGRPPAPDIIVTPVQATLKGPDGKEKGSLRLIQRPDGKVAVRYSGSGLPAGQHAIHFHAKGACDGPDFKSAGDHWQPANWKAEGENAAIDPGHLGTITVQADGSAKADFVNAYASLKTDAPNTLFDSDGVSIVVHDKADPNGARPGGDAGPGIACAVIRPAPEQASTPKN